MRAIARILLGLTRHTLISRSERVSGPLGAYSEGGLIRDYRRGVIGRLSERFCSR